MANRITKGSLVESTEPLVFTDEIPLPAGTRGIVENISETGERVLVSWESPKRASVVDVNHPAHAVTTSSYGRGLQGERPSGTSPSSPID